MKKLTPLLILAILFAATGGAQQTTPTPRAVGLRLPPGDGDYWVEVRGGKAEWFPLTVATPGTGTLPDLPDLPPVEEPDDQLGLKSFTEDQVENHVPEYDNKARDASRLSATYEVIVELIEDETIKQPQDAIDGLNAALDRVFRFSGREMRTNWSDWRENTKAELNRVLPEVNLDDLKQAYREIGYGLDDGERAIGDGQFLRWLVEVLIPLIIQLIGAFS